MTTDVLEKPADPVLRAQETSAQSAYLFPHASSEGYMGGLWGVLQLCPCNMPGKATGLEGEASVWALRPNREGAHSRLSSFFCCYHNFQQNSVTVLIIAFHIICF